MPLDRRALWAIGFHQHVEETSIVSGYIMTREQRFGRLREESAPRNTTLADSKCLALPQKLGVAVFLKTKPTGPLISAASNGASSIDDNTGQLKL